MLTFLSKLQKPKTNCKYYLIANILSRSPQVAWAFFAVRKREISGCTMITCSSNNIVLATNKQKQFYFLAYKIQLFTVYIISHYLQIVFPTNYINIRYRQIFSGGSRTKKKSDRTKIKNWLEDFTPVAGLIHRGCTEKPLKPVKNSQKLLNFPKTVNF